MIDQWEEAVEDVIHVCRGLSFVYHAVQKGVFRDLPGRGAANERILKYMES